MKRFFILFLVVILLFTMTACGANASPSGVVSDCYDAIISGKTEAFLGCFTPEIQIGLPALLGLVGISLEDYIEDSSITKYAITQEKTIDSDHATVTVDITYKSKNVRSLSMDCVKIDGKWYIDFDFLFDSLF